MEVWPSGKAISMSPFCPYFYAAILTTNAGRQISVIDLGSSVSQDTCGFESHLLPLHGAVAELADALFSDVTPFARSFNNRIILRAD